MKRMERDFSPVKDMGGMIGSRYLVEEPTSVVDLHAHTFYEIHYFCEGDLKCYIVGSHSYHLIRGDILVIPPGIMHHPIFERDAKVCRRYVLGITKSYLTHLTEIDPDAGKVIRLCESMQSYLVRLSPPALTQNLENLLHTGMLEHLSDTVCGSLSAHAAYIKFLVELNRMVSEKSFVAETTNDDSPLLDHLIAYIHENFMHAITLQETAAHFYVSPSTVEHLFSEAIGTSFYRYVTELRIVEAKSLIQSGMSLKNVSRNCGYSDYSNFYKAFTKETGCSPGEYRKTAIQDSIPTLPSSIP